MGGQYHHELMKYCPPIYVLCVSSHFWPFIIVKVVLEKLDKNLGFADPHPPQLGQIPKFFQKIDLKAPLITSFIFPYCQHCQLSTYGQLSKTLHHLNCCCRASDGKADSLLPAAAEAAVFAVARQTRF